MAFTYSVQLYSVRTELKNDPPGVLKKLKAMGFVGVEGFGGFDYSSSDFNHWLSDNGLLLAGYHTPWELVQDDKLASTIEYFKAIKNKYAIVPWLPDECRESIDAWKRTAEKFNVISKRLRDEGMFVGYHNHQIEFEEINGELPFTAFFDNTDPDVVVQMDNGNALCGNADVMAMMRRYPGRARTVHLKPYSKTGGFAPIIGEDDINWKEFLHWCRDSGGTEHYIVEYEEEKAHPQLVGVDLCLKGLAEIA